MWSWTLLLSWFVATVCVCLCSPGPRVIFPSLNDTDPREKAETAKPASVSNGKSADMCKKYSESVYYTSEDFEGKKVKIDTCSVREPRIVGGTPSGPREFPHMALIGFPTNYPKNSTRWSCGGSLISERFVLGAAHCTSLNKVKPKYVRLGDYNFLSTKDDDEHNARPTEYEIVVIYAHPEYDSATNYNDIALYKLDRDVEFNEYVRPICLHTDHQLFRSYFLISGWGNIDWGVPGNGILLKANLSYVPWKVCADLVNPYLGNKDISVNDSTMICAVDVESGTSSCQGDGGGPLQYPSKEPYCMYSQVGVDSFGFKCGEKVPSIYTRVSFYVPWIESIVWP